MAEGKRGSGAELQSGSGDEGLGGRVGEVHGGRGSLWQSGREKVNIVEGQRRRRIDEFMSRT